MVGRGCLATATAIVIAGTVASCAHRARRPTISGAAIYSQLTSLQDKGEINLGVATLRKGQVLASANGQAFEVNQVIENCHGGDAAIEIDCTLALLLDQRFTVLDRMPEGKAPRAEGEDQSSSILSSTVVIGFGLAATAGLIYGIATCEFPGCKAVFGVPLVFVGGAALFLLGD